MLAGSAATLRRSTTRPLTDAPEEDVIELRRSLGGARPACRSTGPAKTAGEVHHPLYRQPNRNEYRTILDL